MGSARRPVFLPVPPPPPLLPIPPSPALKEVRATVGLAFRVRKKAGHLAANSSTSYQVSNATLPTAIPLSRRRRRRRPSPRSCTPLLGSVAGRLSSTLGHGNLGNAASCNAAKSGNYLWQDEHLELALVNSDVIVIHQFTAPNNLPLRCLFTHPCQQQNISRSVSPINRANSCPRRRPPPRHHQLPTCSSHSPAYLSLKGRISKPLSATNCP
ncbi:hypothetical protein VTK26DRAFT_5972 [Humicola hyalothermophila]